MGSKLLGRGAYGCVFRPPLRCKDNDELNKRFGNEQYVMKIASSSELEHREEMIGRRVGAVDTTGQYTVTLLPDAHCTIDEAVASAEGCAFEAPVHGDTMRYGGVSLSSLIEQQRTGSRNDIVQAMGHLAQGLALLHEKRIVHLDISPENVLIDNQGLARFADFGLALYIPANGHDAKSVEATWQSLTLNELQRPRPALGPEFAALSAATYPQAIKKIQLRHPAMFKAVYADYHQKPEYVQYLVGTRCRVNGIIFKDQMSPEDRDYLLMVLRAADIYLLGWMFYDWLLASGPPMDDNWHRLAIAMVHPVGNQRPLARDVVAATKHLRS